MKDLVIMLGTFLCICSAFKTQISTKFQSSITLIYSSRQEKGLRRVKSTSSTRKGEQIQAKSVITSTEDKANDGFRVNKCITTLSRRAADKAIEEGRVKINSKVAKPGDRVKFGDVVKLDNVVQKWESIARARLASVTEDLDNQDFIYIKYWKPRGITCTSDLNDRDNIISKGKFSLFPQRLFTVGRLDKDSSGLILLTSDGRVNNALLRKSTEKIKIYEVEMNREVSPQQVKQLSEGVVISTPVQRDQHNSILTAKTLPCSVIPFIPNQFSTGSTTKSNTTVIASRWLRITLIEGRNRQIRRMAEAVGLEVQQLHRVSFAGITLKGLKEGEWLELNSKELDIIRKALIENEKIAKSKSLKDNSNPKRTDEFYDE